MVGKAFSYVPLGNPLSVHCSAAVNILFSHRVSRRVRGGAQRQKAPGSSACGTTSITSILELQSVPAVPGSLCPRGSVDSEHDSLPALQMSQHLLPHLTVVS